MTGLDCEQQFNRRVGPYGNRDTDRAHGERPDGDRLLALWTILPPGWDSWRSKVIGIFVKGYWFLLSSDE